MSSVAEAEVAAVFGNMKKGVIIYTTLGEMEHPQETTEIITDNTTTDGFANGTMKQQWSHAMDMQFDWIKDCIGQKQFVMKWKPGTQNLADYVSKHHPPVYHQKVCPIYLHTSAGYQDHVLWGCVEMSPLVGNKRVQPRT